MSIKIRITEYKEDFIEHNEVSINDIKEYINNIERTIGIKDSIRTEQLFSVIKQNSVEYAVKMIAEQLELPIKIKVVFNSDFETKDIVVQGLSEETYISAQVIIPKNLPLYGTKELAGFPITIKIDPGSYLSYPASFTAIISHELSHILLHSIHSSQCNNEIYTDLTAMMLGFADVYNKGRKIFIHNSIMSTQIITYGYLNNKQFKFALKQIKGRLKKHKRQLHSLIKFIEYSEDIVFKHSANLKLFKKLLQYVYKQHDTKFNPTDAKRIVTLFSSGYIDTLSPDSLKTKIDYLKKYYSKKNVNLVYTERDLAEIRNLKKNIEKIYKTLHSDIKILKKYIPRKVYL